MGSVEARWSLQLLGFWQLREVGEPVAVGMRQQRVIAIVALLGARPRTVIASRLWPESADARAEANLRASLFRISHEQPGVIRRSADTIELERRVDVDVEALRSTIGEVLTGDGRAMPTASTAELSAAELLPGWYDDWVIFEQERLDQQRLGALEAIARARLRKGQFDLAVEAAAAALAIEPLRESAQFLLLQAHLGAGNRAVAARVHQRFRDNLAAEMGLAPSPRFAALIDAGTLYRELGTPARNRRR